MYMRSVENEECEKLKSVEMEECEKLKSVEMEECGKCGVIHAFKSLHFHG